MAAEVWADSDWTFLNVWCKDAPSAVGFFITSLTLMSLPKLVQEPSVDYFQLDRRTLEVTTTIGCKHVCSYCPQQVLIGAHKSTGSGRASKLALDDFSCFLESIPRSVGIHFSGFAEPFANPEAVRMVELASRQNRPVTVFTTAADLVESDIRELSNYKFERFCVHLPDADGLMRLKVDKRYLDGLSQLASCGLNTLDFITLGTVHPEVEDVLDGNVLSTSRLHSRAGNVLPLVGSPVRMTKQADIETRLRSGGVKCRKNRFFQNVLLPSGDVYVCCMDYGLEEPLGNLGVSSYEEVVAGRKFQQFIDRMADTSSDILCRRCEYAIPV